MSVPTSADRHAPEVMALVDLGIISVDYAETSRKLAIVVGDFMVNHLAHDPLIVSLYKANNRVHFIEGMQARKAHIERRWVEYLASIAALEVSS